MTNIEEYMKGKEFFKWNPFLKGYVSNEERKMPIQWSDINFHFFAAFHAAKVQKFSHICKFKCFFLHYVPNKERKLRFFTSVFCRILQSWSGLELEICWSFVGYSLVIPRL